MCFSKEWSAFFSLSSLTMAAYMYPRIGFRVTASILYFGAMEFLQFVQYFYIAEPEDGFSMCKNPTNQFLTALGTLHICFQPYFANYAFGAMRIHNIQLRYEKDLIGKMCLFGGTVLFMRYLAAAYWPVLGDYLNNNHYVKALGWDTFFLAPVPNEDCPNYEWIQQGYDPHLQWTTPNVPGHSCTFRSNTTTGHLAWAVPLYQSTYFVPHYSLHCFLMFVPHLMGCLWKPALCSLVLYATGPFLATYLTPSLNEAGAIWCFFSMAQIFVLVIFMPEPDPIEPVLLHKGTLGEPRLEYQLVEPALNDTRTAKSSNGHDTTTNNGNSNGLTSNGTKQHAE